MADAKIGGDVKVALTLGLLLTLGGLAIGDTTLGLVLTPLVFVLGIYAMSRVPLRTSMMALMFLAFTLENPAEAPGYNVFRTPFFTVGAIMLTHLNAVDRSIGATSWMSFSGMDICLLSLGFIALSRRLTASNIDRLGRVSTPKPLITLAYLSLGGTAYVFVSGMARGGDFSMSLWQMNRVMYLPIVFLLFQLGLRGPRDHAALARVVLVAATYKALLATYVINTVVGPMDPDTGSTRLPYATTHHDSMLFACAFVLLLATVMERVGRSTRRLALLLIPVLALGIVSNNRRMAWVQVAVVFLTVYFVTPDNPVKRKLRRTIYALSPILVAYCLAGWNSKSSFFKPVETIRSVVDAQADASTMWREMENYDLIATVRENPIFGTGYGHGYHEVVQLPVIDYPLERFVPHNSILGLWCYCGYFGYTAMTLLWTVGVYFGIRAYHGATKPAHRAAAIVSFGAVVIYMIQCWGDMGLGSWTGVYMVAPSIAVAGKLAVYTGQWGKKKSREARPTASMPRAEQAA